MSVYDDVRFWAQIQGDAKRTVLCEPDRADEIQAAVEARGYGHLVTVRVSPCCPPGQMIVIDEGAVEASGRQAIQRAARSLYH
ncbi:hypothetical protein [Streptomyces sp. ECR3.8]|uniref:hypothetical protein n=1 Tax=Streptomyces sp. ECR3.8 TaxID=3461009 RepID=UPI00404121C3